MAPPDAGSVGSKMATKSLGNLSNLPAKVPTYAPAVMSEAGGTTGVEAGGLPLLASVPPPPPQAVMPAAKRQAKKEATKGLFHKLTFWKWVL